MGNFSAMGGGGGGGGGEFSRFSQLSKVCIEKGYSSCFCMRIWIPGANTVEHSSGKIKQPEL